MGCIRGLETPASQIQQACLVGKRVRFELTGPILNLQFIYNATVPRCFFACPSRRRTNESEAHVPQDTADFYRREKRLMINILKTVRAAASLLPIALLGAGLLNAQTATIVGYPSNFDAVNNTGEVTHGFEIEADGISSSDLLGIFGGNFPPSGPCLIRYCAGTAVDFPGGVYVRWTSPWDPSTGTFTQGTPLPNGTYAGGESCWTGGLGGAYAAAGCEHFGLSTYHSPTQVIYRWLVADPQNPGQLIRFSAPPGSGFTPQPTPAQVPIPQPVVNVIPPAQPGGQAVVDFMVQVPPPPPPPPFVAPQFGDAQWVKVYKNESPNEVDLNNLLIGDPAVPNDTQVETEWALLQKNPNNANSGILHNQGPAGGGKHAVVRRYVYYKYSGSYEALSHEAVCGGDASCSAPQPGELGDIIGDQMAAANLETPSITVVKAGNGTVTGSNGLINCGGVCTANVTAGTAVVLTAITPSSGIFGGWTGACTGSSSTCSLTVSSALTTTATFDGVFTLSIGRGGNGTVTGTPQGAFNTSISCGSSCSAKFPQGTAVTLSATPGNTGKFVNWTGACSGTTPTCTVTISKDTQVQANFK